MFTNINTFESAWRDRWRILVSFESRYGMLTLFSAFFSESNLKTLPRVVKLLLIATLSASTFFCFAFS
jgi:hypothetical protein